jgi:hypothetical protein
MNAISGVRVRRLVGAVALAAVLTVPAACGSGGSAPSTPAAATVPLAKGFPTDEVPLVDGAVVNAPEGKQSGGFTVYLVTVQASGGADKGFDQAKQLLLGGGYNLISSGTPNGGQTANFSGNGLLVTISTTANGAIPDAVQYSVSKQS